MCVDDGIYSLSWDTEGSCGCDSDTRYLHNRNAQMSVDSTNQYNLESDNCSVPARASLPAPSPLRRAYNTIRSYISVL